MPRSKVFRKLSLQTRWGAEKKSEISQRGKKHSLDDWADLITENSPHYLTLKVHCITISLTFFFNSQYSLALQFWFPLLCSYSTLLHFRNYHRVSLSIWYASLPLFLLLLQYTHGCTVMHILRYAHKQNSVKSEIRKRLRFTLQKANRLAWPFFTYICRHKSPGSEKQNNLLSELMQWGLGMCLYEQYM